MENIVIKEMELLDEDYRLKVMRKKVRRYYERKKYIEVLTAKIKMLNIGILKMEEDLTTSNFNLKTDISSINYDGVGTDKSFNTESYIEKDLINQVGKIEKKINEKKLEVSQMQEKLEELKEKNFDIDVASTFLKEDLKNIMQYKFKERKSNIEISLDLGLGESTVRKYVNQVLLELHKWCSR